MSVLSKCAAALGVVALLGLGGSSADTTRAVPTGVAGRAQAGAAGAPSAGAAKAAKAAKAASAGAAKKTGWRIVSVSPEYIRGDGFSDIVATGPNDAWAVGSLPCCTPDSRKISHWDGTAWTTVTLPSAPQGALSPTLTTVGASSPDDVWTFGSGVHGPAFGHHWDGTAWQTTTFSADLRIKETAVIAPGNVWVTGLERTGTGDVPVTEHFDGTQWTKVPLPSGLRDVDAISADASGDLRATGNAGGGVPVILHWDGSAWRTDKLPLPALKDGVFVVAGDVLTLGPDNAWATGTFANQQGLVPGMISWHWDGKRWNLVPNDAPSITLTRLASDGGNGLWMVSADEDPMPSLLHNAPQTATFQGVPVEPDISTAAAVNEIVLIPGTHSLWAVGSLANRDGSAATVFRYDPAA